MRESNAITTRTIPCWKLFSLKYSGAVHGRMLRGKSRSISVSTGDRILDRPQMLGAVGSMGVLLHSGGDDERTFGTSRWRPRKGYERNCASLGLEEDQSCGFSGIFDGRANVVEPDPAWRSGGTTLQGHSTQQFTTAEPIRVDHSQRVELVLRLVVRDGEKDLEFPKGECKPLSTLTPPPVQE